jgi:lysophospholipase L1-like esterase
LIIPAILFSLSTTLQLFQLSNSCAGEPIVEDVIPRGTKVLLLGDSLAEGLKFSLRKKGEADGYNVAAETERGTRADQWSHRIKKIIKEKKPSLVLISLGTNDSFLKDAAPQRAHIQKIVNEVNSSGARIVWILPPSLPTKATSRKKIVDMIEEEMSGCGDVLDSKDITFERNKDGIHYSSTGYTAWASLVWDLLVSRKIVH